MKSNKLAALAVAATLAVTGVTVSVASASATNNRDTTCVPSPEIPATPGTPEVPAVPSTPEIPAVPATPDHWENTVWHNYTGNDKAYPPDGPGPALDDPNWHALPAEPNGVHAFELHTPNVPYNVSNDDKGRGSWFLWTGTFVPGTPGTPAVPATPGTPAVPAVPGTPAVPAVTCPETPTETPTTPPTTPETPESTPTPQPPKDVQVIACVNGVWTTQVNGETISEAGTCAEDEDNTTFQTFQETGL